MFFLISCATDPLFLLCHHCLLVCNGVAEDGNSLAKSKIKKIFLYFYILYLMDIFAIIIVKFEIYIIVVVCGFLFSHC